MLSQDQFRISWVDYSKGIFIVSIVALLSARYVQGMAETDGWVQYGVDFAAPFRTPGFFVVAGLFLARTIDRPWRSYLDKKVLHFAYFFVLWTTFYFVAAIFNGEFDGDRPIHVEYLGWYVHPFKALWFIEMLPVFFVVTRLLRRVPWALVLPLAALLQIWSPESDFRQVERFCERYVYFYAGYVFAPAAFRLAEAAVASRVKAIAGVLAWAAVNEWLVLAGLADEPIFSLLLGFAGSGAVIVVASLLSGSRSVDWLRYLGQHSLVIFLAFYFFTVLFGRAVAGTGLVADVGWQTLLVTIISTVGPILLYWAVRKTPFRFIFERPGWLSLAQPAAPAIAERGRAAVPKR